MKQKSDHALQLDDKINWLNILHFYQPPFQDMDVVRQVTEECYLPVTRLLLERPDAKAVININGCLFEMFDRFQEGKEVVANLRSLYSSGQIEVTGTGKYHPILPLIGKEEIEIQVLRQEMSLHSFLGMKKPPIIMFLPELAYWPEQTLIFEEQGYRWIIIDEISIKNEKHLMGKHRLKEIGSDISLLVRERDISDSIANAPWRKFDIHTSGEFLHHSRERLNDGGFIVTVSDVEVFGHHQKKHWKLLASIYDNSSVNSISAREVIERYETVEVETVPASWSTSMDDISNRVYYPLWHHPHNRLHRLLWHLLDITMEEVRATGSESQNRTMDALLSSCPFSWASCMPWWNGIIVENTADNLFNLLSEIEGCVAKILTKAKDLREDIYSEVSMFNETGKAERLQNEFLSSHKINRRDLHHLLHE